MYKKKLLYTVAQNKEGKLVNAHDADKGEIVCCPVCKGKMTLKRSEAQKRRPHFAHKALTANCTPESALHFAFKTLLYERICASLENDLAINIEWKCSICEGVHTGSLIKKAKQAEIETNLDSTRPDITLLDESDRPIVAIEVVVTHKPEEKTLEYFKNNRIELVQFTLKSEEDLEQVKGEVLYPSHVSCCSSYPKCPSCGKYMIANRLYIISQYCRKCPSLLTVAYIEDQSDEGIPSKTELDFAKARGARIRFRQRYEDYVNVCPDCGDVVNSFVIYWRSQGDDILEQYIAKFYCEDCKTRITVLK